MKQIAILVLKIYRATYWFRTPCCRFYPTCSKYAQQSIEEHGLIVGLLLSAGRILRCHPFCAGGVDEVPRKTYVTGRHPLSAGAIKARG